jgi:diaphanous 1
MLKGVIFLKESVKIRDLLEQVLAIGNYLNGQTNRGGAYGFKIDSLVKLSDIKMKDNKTTLFMYIIDIVEKKHGPLIT